MLTAFCGKSISYFRLNVKQTFQENAEKKKNRGNYTLTSALMCKTLKLRILLPGECEATGKETIMILKGNIVHAPACGTVEVHAGSWLVTQGERVVGIYDILP